MRTRLVLVEAVCDGPHICWFCYFGVQTRFWLMAKSGNHCRAHQEDVTNPESEGSGEGLNTSVENGNTQLRSERKDVSGAQGDVESAGVR